MSLVDPKQLYKEAKDRGCALAAFNIYSLESLNAVLEEKEKKQAASIVQISIGSRKYVKDFSLFVKVMRMYCERSKARVFIQHDHCKTIEECSSAIEAGVQAVMFDGSHLPFEDNIAETKKVVELAHEKGVWVEAELGRIPGFEDTVFSGHAEYTNPDKAKEFIERTGCDALAISVGTSHGGVLTDKNLDIDFDLLKRILEIDPAFPFVLHGAASLPSELIEQCNLTGMNVPDWKMCLEKDIRRAVELGVSKTNMDVDNFIVTTTAARNAMINKPDVYDPRKYLAPAYSAFEKEVEHKLENVVLSAGRWTND